MRDLNRLAIASSIALVATFSVNSIELKASEKITVSGHNLFQPFCWKKGDKLVGIGPRLFKQVIKDLKKDFAAQFLPWKRAQIMARKGKVDVLLSLFKTSEREKFLSFSEKFSETNLIVFTRRDFKRQITSWEDLSSYRGVAIRGASSGKMDQFFTEKYNLSRVENTFQMLKMVQLKRADFATSSKYAAVIETKKRGLDSVIQIHESPKSAQSIYLAISKKSWFIEYLPQVNHLIRKYKGNGVLDRIIRESIQEAVSH